MDALSDEHLSNNQDDVHFDTVVQPDIVVICDRSKLDDKGGKGTPDLVIEILSPSSINHDKMIKFNRYLKAGVREYWIVDPDNKTVLVNILKDGQYISNTYGDHDVIPIHALEGCTIHFKYVFI